MKFFKLFCNMFRPYGYFYRCIQQQFFRAFFSQKLAQFKGIHAGERCFIVGNGPSLKNYDLTFLRGEKTFVTNLFNLHPLAESLQPTYYCISDWLHWTDELNGKIVYKFPGRLLNDFPKLKNTTFFFDYDAQRVVKKTHELTNCKIHYLFINDSESVHEGKFSDNICKPLYWGQSVTIDFCLPLAIYMGFKEIYLVGNDYDYKLDSSDVCGQGAYFYGISEDVRSVTNRSTHLAAFVSKDRAELANKSLYIINEYASLLGQKIKKIGSEGKLTVLPSVDFTSLFK